jgi:hypothetical protein
MPKYQTFGHIKVAKRNPGPRDFPLTLTFIDQKTFDDTRHRLLREGFEIVDQSFSFKLFRDVDDAMESVYALVGKPEEKR